MKYKLIKHKPIIKSASIQNFNCTSRSTFSSHSQTTNHSSMLTSREYTGKRCFAFLDLTNSKKKALNTMNTNINTNDFTHIGMSTKPTKLMFDENECGSGSDKEFEKERDRNASELIRRLKAWDSEHLNNSKGNQSNCISNINLHINNNNNSNNNDQFQKLTSLNPSSLMLNDLANMKSKKKNRFKLEEKKQLKYNTKNTFNFDVFRGQSHLIAQEAKTVEQKLEMNIQELHQPDQYSRYVKEQMKIESINRDNLMKVYQKMIVLKMKKCKYQGIIDDIYLLLDQARQESFLLTDLLSDRRKAVDKRYEAFKIEPINPQSELEEEQRQRENEEALLDTKKKCRFRSKRIGKLSPDDSNRTPSISQYLSTGKRRDSNKSSKDEDIQVFKKKKKTLLEIYEEKRKIRQQYLEIIQDIENKIKTNQDQFTQIKEQLKKLIEKNKDEIEVINHHQAEYKLLYQEMSKNQQNYYLTILKQGIDTRTEGLSWVIKKLIELKTPLDNSHFPPFLNLEQIDYLLDISKINYESSQLKVILCTFKTRQRIILGQQNKNTLEKINLFTMKKEQEKGKPKKPISSLNETQDNLDTFKQRVNAILIKQETLFKSQFENKIEERQIDSITGSIKDKLMEYAVTGKNFINDNEDNVVKFMLEYEKKAEFFEDILLLRKRIKDLDLLSRGLYKEQIELFKSKYDYTIKRPNINTEAQYGLIYSALFGQG